MQLIVAEKPSVARDLARVLGVPARGAGAFRGDGVVITWCVGHLVELEEPAAYDPAWRRWRLETLPILPEAFRLRAVRGASARQWRVVRELLHDPAFTEVVNACDAGREGELIFRYCRELAGGRAPVVRLWISALTDAAIREGLARLRPAAQLDALADAARCRSEADWLVGMNATRALTVKARGAGGTTLFSIGRVQTPTLALIVERERAIRSFVPVAYAEVEGSFTSGAGAELRARWTWAGRSRLAPPLGPELVARVQEGAPRVEAVERTVEREPPPLLFDLTSLQRTANRRYGWSAKHTLDVAQALYERHKRISYPRTDSRHLPASVRGELEPVLAALASTWPELAPFVAEARGRARSPAPLRRIFDDRRVGDHHAIVPTSRAGDLGAVDGDARRLLELIVRRFLAAFQPDAELERTQVTVIVGEGGAPPPPAEAAAREVPLDALPPPPDRFVARGRLRRVAGWHEVAQVPAPTDALPALVPGEALAGRYQAIQRQTEPPRRHTDASILGAMETAGREIADEELRAAMADAGLGTPATRAATIETLLERRYLRRDGKLLAPTPLGEELIARLPVPSLASPELTGRWEARLARMARGDGSRAAFMADIRAYVKEVVETIAAAAAAPAGPGQAVAEVGECPRCGAVVAERFKFFACARCPFKVWKRIAGKTVSPALAAVLLRGRRTRRLPGFRSKAGKRFSAALILDEAGAVRLSFDDPVSPAGSSRARTRRSPRGPRPRRGPA